MQPSGFNRLLFSQTLAKLIPDVQLTLPALSHSTNLQLCRGFLTTASLDQNQTKWKQRDKYTIKPIGMKKTGGRDHTGEAWRKYSINNLANVFYSIRVVFVFSSVTQSILTSPVAQARCGHMVLVGATSRGTAGLTSSACALKRERRTRPLTRKL